MNIFKGVENHSIKIYRSKDGKPLRNPNAKKPAGMSARQWAKLRRDARIAAALNATGKLPAGPRQKGGR